MFSRRAQGLKLTARTCRAQGALLQGIASIGMAYRRHSNKRIPSIGPVSYSHHRCGAERAPASSWQDDSPSNGPRQPPPHPASAARGGLAGAVFLATPALGPLRGIADAIGSHTFGRRLGARLPAARIADAIGSHPFGSGLAVGRLPEGGSRSYRRWGARDRRDLRLQSVFFRSWISRRSRLSGRASGRSNAPPVRRRSSRWRSRSATLASVSA